MKIGPLSPGVDFGWVLMAPPKLGQSTRPGHGPSHEGVNSMATHLAEGIRTPPGGSHLFGEVGG